METLQDYLDTMPNADHRKRLEEVVQWALDRSPELELEIKWNHPMITHHGTFIIGFSTSSKHVSVSPEPQILETFRDQLTAAGYAPSKAIFRIQWTQEVNYPLLAEILAASLEFKQGSTTFWAK